jgi:hypothetical protein
MVRKWIWLILALSVTLPKHSAPVTAQGSNLHALTHYALTVYSGPDRANAIVGVLTPQAKVIVEARNKDMRWILGHSTDGALRGWMESRFLALPSGANLPALHVSSEHMFVPEKSGAPYREINLDNYPIIPANMGRARDIYQHGQALGNRPNTLSKIGDCISDNGFFLSPFGWSKYNLGTYKQLQGVIDHFNASLAYDSQAAYNGLVTNAALDPLFANPLACLPGETPLRCEYRIHRPSVAVIMFGAQDLLFTPPDQFETNLRQIIHETIEAGVIPILSTFPGNTAIWDKAIAYNQIVVRVALDYDIPLMNLWRALERLPNYGLDADGRHLSLPFTSAGDLNGINLQRGYTMRNLVTLQTLDAVWHSVMY